MLLSLEHISDDVLLGLWQIDANPALSPRENERQAVHSLLAVMTSDTLELSHADNGKPLVDGYQISISHTKGFVAIMLSKTRNVGVDIEYVSNRVARIAKRFLRNDECASNITALLIHWCSKETIYKLYSEENLTYQQMKVVDYQPSQPVFHVESESSQGVKALTEVYYRVTPDYILTYSYL